MATHFKPTRQHLALAVVFAIFIGAMIVSGIKSRSIDAQQLDEVVRTLAQPATTLPTDGLFALPQKDARLSVDGFAYLTGGSPPKYVLLPEWRGAGTQIVARMWSPLAVEVGSDIEALVPRTPLRDEAGANLVVPPTTMRPVRVSKKLRENWYQVERRAED